MIDLENVKQRFKNHVAKFSDYGNIKVLDFGVPGCSNWRIRFIFEEDYYRLHISGDIGELIAYNCNNMTWEGFNDFVDNPEYFKEKVRTMSQDMYEYDERVAEEDLYKKLIDCEIEYDLSMYNSQREAIEEIIERVMTDFDDRYGIGTRGQEILEDFDDTCWEYIKYVGRCETDWIRIYLLAFKLAKSQLGEKNGWNNNGTGQRTYEIN